jgi:hypothetical protein
MDVAVDAAGQNQPSAGINDLPRVAEIVPQRGNPSA